MFALAYVLIGLIFWIFCLVQAERDGVINLRRPDLQDVFVSLLGLAACVIGWPAFVAAFILCVITYGLLRLIERVTRGLR